MPTISFRKRPVWGYLFKGDGSPQQGEEIKFYLTEDLGFTDRHIVLSRTVIAIVGSDGKWTCELWCDEDSNVPVNWRVQFPKDPTDDKASDPKPRDFSLAYETGEAIYIGSLLRLSVSAPVDTQLLYQSINSYILELINNGTIQSGLWLPRFNLLEFDGYTGDGTANDAVAMQSAIDAAYDAGGGTIILPPDSITKISTYTHKNLNNNANIIFKGSGNSQLKLTGVNLPLHIENGVVVFEDVIFTGETNGNVSSDTADASGYLIFLSSVGSATFNRCYFFGMGVSGTGDLDGIVTISNASVKITNCYAGGCSSPTGVFNLVNPNGIFCDNNHFIDYGQIGTQIFDKYSRLGKFGAWIKARTNANANNSLISPQWTFKNSHYDEGIRKALDLDVSAASASVAGYSLKLENESVSSGHLATPSDEFGKLLHAKGFRKVEIENSNAGYYGNLTDHESMILEDCETVVIDNLQHTAGAKWITLRGAVSNLTLIGSALQGNGTHPDGINNEAGATVSFGYGGGDFSTLLDGVPTEGNTLNKLYELIQTLNAVVFPPPVIDTDAEAFLTAVTIPNDSTVFYSGTAQQKTGAEITLAVSNFVGGLKTASLWTKIKAIYPFVGGTAARHKWNLNDPRDLNAAFRLTFSGGWTHSKTGAKPDGIDGKADTFVQVDTHLAQDNLAYGAYLRSIEPGGYDIGQTTYTSGFVGISLQGSGENYFYVCDGAGASVTSAHTAGFHLASRRSSSESYAYRNGSALGTNPKTVNSTTANSQHILLGFGASAYSNREFGLVTLSDGLTDSEALALRNLVEAFQTALGRNV